MLNARKLRLSPSFPIAALICGAIGWRAWYAVQYSQLLDCNNCLLAPAVINEAQPFLLLMCAAWAIGRRLPRWAVAIRLFVGVALCISWGDIAAQQAFSTRLSWYEIRKFWNEAGTLLDFAKVLGTS